ncbi:MAG: hypothetical protein ABI120_02365, partial [Gemmatimonadaceae bacterium]
MQRRLSTLAFLAVASPLVAPPLAAQAPSAAARQITATDYGRAEKALALNTTPLVFGAGITPVWLRRPDNPEWFTYVVRKADGTAPEFL